ncbi:phosphatidylinositol 3,4,5-trisphosphate 5-phosphatase 2B-like isoform X2 [Falco biarmicus]|uniref:phosphatidylinositol 3,4,5-trisphosphate 5-phosphatase 2B-like isoform X2 n=1 Tax=Falco biarmicus TaxID=345155 RepID=UPI0024BD2221|nr:phosphatidylinositol 3,4,5-trisphosphate 5-phosphatase 2B-like isoform X2 [Falco biarmicus]
MGVFKRSPGQTSGEACVFGSRQKRGPAALLSTRVAEGRTRNPGLAKPFGAGLAPCVGVGEADLHRPPSAKTNIPSPSNPQCGHIRTATPTLNISDAGAWRLHPLPPTGTLAIPAPGPRLIAPASAAVGAACTLPRCLHPFLLLPAPFLQPSDTSAVGSVWGGASVALAGCHPFPTAGLARCTGQIANTWFQRHVHTYRILPDDKGLLSVQTIQGIQAKCFRTLPDLVSAYQQPNNGLVTPLLYPVPRPRQAASEDSDGEDGRGGRHVASVVPAGGAMAGTWLSAPIAGRTHISQQLHQRLQEQVHSSPASDFMGFMAEYLNHHLQLDLEALRHGHPQLRHLSTALVTACQALHRQIDFTLAGLETLARVFDPPVSPRSPAREQVRSPRAPAATSRCLVVRGWVKLVRRGSGWGGFGAFRHPKVLHAPRHCWWSLGAVCARVPAATQGDLAPCGLGTSRDSFLHPVLDTVGGEAASPARPQGPPYVRVQPRPTGRNPESPGPVPLCCSKNVCPSLQGLLTSDPDLELLLNKISTVNHLLSSLEKKVLKSLQETVSRHNLALPSVAVAPPPAAKTLAMQSFEVKMGKSQRAALTVDVESGTVAITKWGSGSPEETIHQEKILQLIKYQSVQSKVRLVYNREPQKSLSRDFIFPNARKREAFCQLLQLMKIQHSHLDEPDLISVYIGTWNMGSMPPPRSLASWLTARGLGRTQDETTACIPHDVYVIGTQENSLGDREWVEFLRASLKTLMAIDYRVVALQCLWSIKIVVLVKPEHERRISHVHTSSVKTGIANTLGNKGAVGVSFLFNGTSFGFVNCHLASGSEKTHRRNQNYSDILHSLVLGDKRLAAFDLTLRFTHLFWFGDLNYRLDMDVQDILAHITKKEFEALLAVDQLSLEREKNKVFLRFSEGDISFPPTYRYERGSRDSYVWQKFKATGMRINVPSWCDRILWKSHPETHVVCNSYGCTDDIVTSDHSPVFATFEVGVTSQFVPKKAPGSSPEPLACIEWDSIEVIVKTTSRSKCYIEFHSYCLEEAQRSGENTFQSCDIPGFLRLGWSTKHLPVLNPILPDLEYLGDQHLLLSIKGVESCESYGECCIAMRSMIGSMAQQFETFLFHRGEETGSIRGWMKVRVPKDRCSTRERLYEWISFEEEDAEPAADVPTYPRPPLQRLRSRPRSLPEPATGYTNPAYFIFEGVPNTWVPAPGAGKAHNKQVESPPRGQWCRRPLGVQVPSPSEEERWGGWPHCVPGGLSRGHPLSPPGTGRQKRPKSAILARDTPGLGDCSLMALHMATCLSQLDWVAPRRGGDSQKTPLHQTHSTLEPPPQPCQEVPRCTSDAHQHGHPGEWPYNRGEWCHVGSRCLGHLGLQQDEEGLQKHGWDHLEIFRDIMERDLLETRVLSPAQPRLSPSSLGEGTAVTPPQRPDLGPSA